MVRWLVIVMVVLGTTAHAGSLSNPSFVGIGMGDVPGGCQIDTVTKGSPAQDAGIHPLDIVLALDGVMTPNCDVMRNAIIAHPPGEVVRFDVQRSGGHTALDVTLSTRADVLHRRYVGQPMDPIELTDVDDADRHVDLTDPHRTVVVGWFSLEHCVGCAVAFDHVVDRLAKRNLASAPLVLAITKRGRHDDLAGFRSAFRSSVPLAVVDDDRFEDLAIDDPDRIHFMVIDCHGVVQFVAPVAPDSDDLDAAIDEVLAATEQAEHASRR